MVLVVVATAVSTSASVDKLPLSEYAGIVINCADEPRQNYHLFLSPRSPHRSNFLPRLPRPFFPVQKNARSLMGSNTTEGIQQRFPISIILCYHSLLIAYSPLSSSAISSAHCIFSLALPAARCSLALRLARRFY